MRLSPSMTVGAILGFVVGIAFAITGVFLRDEEQIGAGETLLYGIVIGLPITVVMGTAAGWLWDVFIRVRK